jgi:hypothetical protein
MPCLYRITNYKLQKQIYSAFLKAKLPGFICPNPVDTGIMSMLVHLVVSPVVGAGIIAFACPSVKSALVAPSQRILRPAPKGSKIDSAR